MSSSHLTSHTKSPDFATWSQSNLAKYAAEQYQQNIELREALEQVRLDLKDAMALLRRTNKEPI
jgi:hypothetical protein